ncbi:HTH domain-containing protein [Flavivirga jejuensis]|uniref:HTH domain-containing protein n=1 Tax=Flavivirga jejuensis TaxID=870487 RepID=A0ABT8WVH5_9FLAO|nr:HTH domain-containing protein [Flavivirga jejuensis]MDO5977173.1 HTH domain-containing protein [Flavivirga jejuensis]
MKSIKQLERLQQLHQRIEQENTGTPKELAQFMSISERLLYNLIEELKDISAPVCYNRSLKTYYYNDDFKLQINISVTALSNNEVLQLFGGSYFLKKTNSLQGLCSLSA